MGGHGDRYFCCRPFGWPATAGRDAGGAILKHCGNSLGCGCTYIPTYFCCVPDLRRRSLSLIFSLCTLAGWLASLRDVPRTSPRDETASTPMPGLPLRGCSSAQVVSGCPDAALPSASLWREPLLPCVRCVSER